MSYRPWVPRDEGDGIYFWPKWYLFQKTTKLTFVNFAVLRTRFHPARIGNYANVYSWVSALRPAGAVGTAAPWNGMAALRNGAAGPPNGLAGAAGHRVIMRVNPNPKPVRNLYKSADSMSNSYFRKSQNIRTYTLPFFEINILFANYILILQNKNRYLPNLTQMMQTISQSLFNLGQIIASHSLFHYEHFLLTFWFHGSNVHLQHE